MRTLYAELHKGRRRYHCLLSLSISLFAILWASQLGGSPAEYPGCGYSAFFYGVPIINTVVMPVGVAVLASRIWDIENRESNCRLLFTLETRKDLFLGKATVGLWQILLICLLEGGGLLALGAQFGYTEQLDGLQFFWLLLCTFSVSSMLYFLMLFLSIQFVNQAPVLAAGIVGSLSGLFAAFMPQWLSRFLPWGYYIPLSVMGMDWNRATQEIRYVSAPYPVGMLAVTVLFLGLFAWMSWRALRQKEV